MKVSLKKLSIHFALIGSCLLTSNSITALELPNYITFTNETSLSLGTSISGLPGSGVAPNTTKSAPYATVGVGCYFGKVLNNCPIEFTDKKNGAPVATVYINAETATLTRPPVFHGTYGDLYEVTGWESYPISHIKIVQKVTE